MKNKRIKLAMLQAGINQAQLAKLLNVSEPELSNILKYELAVKEQNNITATIREYAAMKEGGKE